MTRGADPYIATVITGGGQRGRQEGMELSRNESHREDVFLEAARTCAALPCGLLDKTGRSGEKTRGEKWKVRGRQREGTLQCSMSVNVTPAASDVNLIRGDRGNRSKNASIELTEAALRT